MSKTQWEITKESWKDVEGNKKFVKRLFTDLAIVVFSIILVLFAFYLLVLFS
ncbi:MAG: hypothetical protein AABY22_11680 [Nanoarchaeota archaeon]